MPRSTRKSLALQKAESRLKGMQSLNQLFTTSNEFSLKSYSLAIENLQRKLNHYNETIDNLNRAHKEIELAEEALNDMSEHMLLSVAAMFGKSSNEYAIAGGTRKNTIRRGTHAARTADLTSG